MPRKGWMNQKRRKGLWTILSLALLLIGHAVCRGKIRVKALQIHPENGDIKKPFTGLKEKEQLIL